MGILDELGVGGSIPKINLTGFLSSTWIYVFIIVFLGILLVVGAGIFFFFLTFKKKVIIFENISGQGYHPILKTRARIVKLGIGGEEILKTLFGGLYLSAYGKKMGKNTYWYAKGQDGYLYNIVLGDLDTKMGMLDIEPIDRDVRMFHVALDRLSHSTYGKQNFMEKYGIPLLLFAFLIVLIFGIWFIVGKIGDAVAPLAQSSEIALKVQEMNIQITNQLENIVRQGGYQPVTQGGSGLAPAG
jgi:hypothetical protein